MPIISALEARQLTQSRAQQLDSFIHPWREVFNTKVRNTAQGSRSTAATNWVFFDISAASALLKEARDLFLQEIRDAEFVVKLHDSDDDSDYCVYKISW